MKPWILAVLFVLGAAIALLAVNTRFVETQFSSKYSWEHQGLAVTATIRASRDYVFVDIRRGPPERKIATSETALRAPMTDGITRADLRLISIEPLNNGFVVISYPRVLKPDYMTDVIELSGVTIRVDYRELRESS